MTESFMLQKRIILIFFSHFVYINAKLLYTTKQIAHMLQ